MLNKNDILDLTNAGLKVFQYYLKIDFRIGRNFLNPLYKDTKASCNVYYDRNKQLYKMKDFGNDDYSGDCFALVGRIYGKVCSDSSDFLWILSLINQDLNLGLEHKGQSINKKIMKNSMNQKEFVQTLKPYKKSKPYTIIQKVFSEQELKFWSQSQITSQILNLYQVISLKEFSSKNKDDKSYKIETCESEPIFAYRTKNYIKLYRPYSSIRYLYAGDSEEFYCFGLQQLPIKGDILFITGGERDVLSLAAHGLQAICFNSESSNIPKSIIRKLIYRFKHIIILYDMDQTGLESSLKHQQQLSEFGINRLLLPLKGTKDEKDITDYFRLGNNRDNFLQLFVEYLNIVYSETMLMLKSCEIDFNNPPPDVQTIISINDVPIGTQGNLLCITGSEGSGKSNYSNSLIAGAINTAQLNVDILGTTVSPNKNNKTILLYDTEQSEVQLYKNFLNIQKRSKRVDMPVSFKAYCLTGMSRVERMQAIVQSMDKYYYEGGIHLVIIDGIADLISSVNDEMESIRIVDELYRLAAIYKTCIVCVLHFVPSGLKLRGHLGSELQRKAAAIVSIEKDSTPNISVIKALKVRDGSPLDVPLIQFEWNKELGMHTYLGEKTKEEKDKRKELELIHVTKRIFKKQTYFTYTGLCEEIQSLLDVKERTAKSYIKFMREKEIIIHDPSNSNVFIIASPKS